MKTLPIQSILILLILSLTNCSLIPDNTISGTLEDQFSGEGLENVDISFDVVSPGFLFGGNVEKGKYQATTGVGGSFEFEVQEDDLEYKFSPNFDRFAKPYDSTDILWNYTDYAEGIHKGEDVVIKLRPGGITLFIHPMVENPSTVLDTIVINANSQTDTLTKNHLYSNQFYFNSFKIQEYELIYIDENEVINLKEGAQYIPNVIKPKDNGYYLKSVRINVPEL